MSGVLIALFGVLAAAVAVLLAAIALPLHLELRAARDETLRFSLTVRPFGRFGPRIPLRNDKPKSEKTPKAAEQTRQKRSRWRGKPRLVIGAVIRLVTDIFGLVRLDRVELDMRFGTGDPAETGQAFGMLAPLIYGARGSQRIDFHVEPVFDRKALTGHANVDLSIIPALLVPPVVRFGWAVFGPAR